MSMHTKWHSTYRWQQHRLRQLQQQPLCAMCLTQGKVTAATVADHITPHKGDYELFGMGRCSPYAHSITTRPSNASSAKAARLSMLSTAMHATCTASRSTRGIQAIRSNEGTGGAEKCLVRLGF